NVWRLYNKKAAVRDKALLDDWKSSISDGTVIFNGLFASVVTAFCVESRKLLEEDPLNSINSMVRYIVEKEANISTPLVAPQPFKPPKWAVYVNGLLFMSLCFSLITALVGMMCLQWVKEYEWANNTYYSTEERKAICSHYQYMGARNWGMGGYIVLSQTLLHVAALFLLGGLAI
ncbi:hypothetical protein CPB86DRAFT_868082, partial [Serendipita vermifera]